MCLFLSPQGEFTPQRAGSECLCRFSMALLSPSAGCNMGEGGTEGQHRYLGAMSWGCWGVEQGTHLLVDEAQRVLDVRVLEGDGR